MFNHKKSAVAFRASVSVVAILALMPAVAMAQEVPPKATDTPTTAKKPEPSTEKPANDQKAVPKATDDTSTTVVTVTAEKPNSKHLIDRDVYDVKQDPQSATGSAADALNNVPAVTVDADGTVSLRGNSGVQVYVNGKKSAQMQGDNRGFSLQSMNADDIDSVEVIANPGAAFDSSTAGGIINIVLKRGRAIKPQTSVNVTYGDQGRSGLALRTGKNIDKLTLNASLSLNHGSGGNGRGGRGDGSGGQSPKVESFSDRIILDPLTGLIRREDVTRSIGRSQNDNLSANLTAEYALGDNDDIGTSVNYSRRKSKSRNTSNTITTDSGDLLFSDIDRLSQSSAPSDNVDMRLTYNHRGPVGSTESFKMQLTHSASMNSGYTLTQSDYTYPDKDTTFTTYRSKSKTSIESFSGDWSHPLSNYDTNQQQIQLGWNIQKTISENNNYRSLPLLTATSSPSLIETASARSFRGDELLSAVYATYQHQMGRFGVQVGLRVEDLHQAFNSNGYPALSPAKTIKHYSLTYSPSVFATYKVSDKDNFKFSYSQKIQRPSAQQLDPTIVISTDGLTARSGNADLEDTKVDKFNLSYNHDNQYGNINVQSFYNKATGNIESVSLFLVDKLDVLLTTYENAGRSTNSGVTGSLSARIFNRALRINLSSNYVYTNTQYHDPLTRELLTAKGPASSAILNLNYRVGDSDNFGFRLQSQGRSKSVERLVTAQSSFGVSWQHQIIPNKMLVTLNASNIIIGATRKSYNSSRVQRSFSQTYDSGASLMLSLRYTFGAVRGGQSGEDNRRPDRDRGGERF